MQVQAANNQVKQFPGAMGIETEGPVEPAAPAIMGYEDMGRVGDVLQSRWTFYGGAELLVDFPIPKRVPKLSRLMKARLRNDKAALKAYGVQGDNAIEEFLEARGV